MSVTRDRELILKIRSTLLQNENILSYEQKWEICMKMIIEWQDAVLSEQGFGHRLKPEGIT
jgi:hypothetical protein